MPDCLGPDRIQDHIVADLQKVNVLLNENRLKPALTYMTDPAVPLVKGLGIHAVQLPYTLRQVAVRCFDNQVIVVVHQTIDRADPMETVGDLSQDIQKERSIAIVLEDCFAIVAT
jgi:hypothetical protein